MRRISKKYTGEAEREKNIKKGNQEKRRTIEMPLSQDTCAALDCVLLLRAQTHNVCVCVCVCLPCNIFYLDVRLKVYLSSKNLSEKETLRNGRTALTSEALTLAFAYLDLKPQAFWKKHIG